MLTPNHHYLLFLLYDLGTAHNCLNIAVWPQSYTCVRKADGTVTCFGLSTCRGMGPWPSLLLIVRFLGRLCMPPLS